MTAPQRRRRATRSVSLVVSFVVVLVSATYVVVDLARWEWNRAVLAALVCVAALVVFATVVLLGQLVRLDQRLDDVMRRGASERTVLPTRPAEPGVGAPHFPWLEQPRDRGVFVPILLGAGAILSFLASVIERVSGVVAHTGLDPGELERMGVRLPLGDAVEMPGVVDAPPRRRFRRVSAAVLGVLCIAVAVEGLRELTQSRPGDVMLEGTTVVEVIVQQRRAVQDPTVVVVELWGACRSRLGTGVSPASVAGLADGRVRLELDRALGTTGRRRLIGCFQDHTLDLVRADVVRVESRTDPTGA